MVHRRLAGAGLAVLGAFPWAACGGQGEIPPRLELARFRQADRGGVYLNETLVLHFSEDLAPESITSESVRIQRADGSPVSGRFDVERSLLEFHPELPKTPSLTDGGFSPGAKYTVRLLGFPRPDGVRARTGEILSGTIELSFETVGREEERLFLDLAPELEQPVLWIVAKDIGPLDPIRLECGSPLDPVHVVEQPFELVRARAPDGSDGGEDQDPIERLSLRARLVRNDQERGALIELHAMAGGATEDVYRALDPGDYFLWLDPQFLRLSTLAGSPVQPLWGSSQPVEIRVVGRQISSREVTFDDATDRSPEPVENVDGTAAWGDGSVRVRLPAAAGDGRDGPLSLAEEGLSKDVHATRLSLPAGATADLSGLPGLVVLRSQGSIELDGRFVRRVEQGALGWRPDESHFDWSQRTAGAEEWEVPAMAGDFLNSLGLTLPQRDWLLLSEWLARAQEDDHRWTILIAGGDIRVRGQIEVDGPLLLVAGGWVRVFGHVASREVWRTREGGGDFSPASVEAPLTIDEPEENPLRERLRFAVLSGRIRPPRGAARWRPLIVDGQAGKGRYEVRLYGERHGPEGAAVFGPVNDVALLEGCQEVRFQVELEVPPGPGPWDPPRVESVTVSWYEVPSD